MTEFIDTRTGARLTVSGAQAARAEGNPRYARADTGTATTEVADEAGALDPSEPQIPTVDDDQISRPTRRRRKSEDA